MTERGERQTPSPCGPDCGRHRGPANAETSLQRGSRITQRYGRSILRRGPGPVDIRKPICQQDRQPDRWHTPQNIGGKYQRYSPDADSERLSHIGVSEATVKAHRANVMRKMQSESLIDLANMASRLGISLPKS